MESGIVALRFLSVVPPRTTQLADRQRELLTATRRTWEHPAVRETHLLVI